jgi:hypothetical protein
VETIRGTYREDYHSLPPGAAVKNEWALLHKVCHTDEMDNLVLNIIMLKGQAFGIFKHIKIILFVSSPNTEKLESWK